MKKFKVFLKKTLLIIALLLVALYVLITFVNQQKLLSTYKASCIDLDEQIEEAKQYNEELNKTKENVNSKEYIEKIAREKLDMYYPNERVYIDSEQ